MSAAKQKPAEWEAAEKAFSCVFTEFRRLGAGNSSRNFRAVLADGGVVLVKFANDYRTARFLPRLQAISSPLVPRPAFGGATGKFGRYVISAQEWCARGANVPADQLTDAQLRGIVAGHAQLLDALAAVDASTLPSAVGVVAAARGCGLEPCTIHGDFHYRNFFMDGDSMTACFDLESVRRGLPTEDLLRVFAHPLERTRIWYWRRMNVLYRNFARLVEFSPYGRDAWLAAIDIHESNKAARRLAKKRRRRIDIFAKFEAMLRAPLYRRLRRIVAEVKGDG